MTRKLFLQILSAVVLSVAAFFLVNPMHIWMPNNVHMLTLAIVVAISGVFAALILAEGRGDEREESHQAFAGRAAFFVGALVLSLGITAQTFAHALDAWLVYALVAMVVAKVVARIFAERNR